MLPWRLAGKKYIYLYFIVILLNAVFISVNYNNPVIFILKIWFCKKIKINKAPVFIPNPLVLVFSFKNVS